MAALWELSLSELTERLRRREVSAREAAVAYLDRIEATDERLGAFLHVDREGALAQAEAIDASRAPAGGETGRRLLWGAPIALKDILAVKGQPLTCGSRILEHFVSPYDATVVERLRREGAVFLGRLNMDEFAMGSSTENSAFKKTRNPWDLERSPGGSSGGCAAATAARQCPAAIGSDTGGSVRQPAAFCGVTGLKPTYGRVSRYGLVAYASSLDQIGPVTLTTRDAALLLQAIAGYDPRDSTSLPAPTPDYLAALDKGVRDLRVGLPKEYFVGGLDPRIREAVYKAARTLEQLGATVEEISLPHTEYAVAAYYIIAPAEASANLARFDGVRYGLRVQGRDPIEMYSKTRAAGFGPEVKRRVILGTYALSSGYYDAYYLRALKVRRLISRDFEEAFRQVDVLVTPTSPTPAFRLGEKTEDPLQMYLSDIYTAPCNLAGLCGISVPGGLVEPERLPVGVQFLGKPLGEETLLRVAYAYEQASGCARLRPPIAEEDRPDSLEE
ncbi:MAG: Asp-tRNA(Asn)/Glu-tRNA(Gln) amidotransferase subunit GatA [Verrucomicrobia bacterium]|nr:Asp-tRNA(Asn)/Glu-tRNA(Gln) amidotransferase subunit GatA [Verrucomicrobiota bacterium]